MSERDTSSTFLSNSALEGIIIIELLELVRLDRFVSSLKDDSSKNEIEKL